MVMTGIISAIWLGSASAAGTIYCRPPEGALGGFDGAGLTASCSFKSPEAPAREKYLINIPLPVDELLYGKRHIDLDDRTVLDYSSGIKLKFGSRFL